MARFRTELHPDGFDFPDALLLPNGHIKSPTGAGLGWWCDLLTQGLTPSECDAIVYHADNEGPEWYSEPIPAAWERIQEPTLVGRRS